MYLKLEIDELEWKRKVDNFMRKDTVYKIKLYSGTTL